MSAPAPRWAGADAERDLRTSSLEVVGRLVEASNATLMCDLDTPTGRVRCVYKPTAGERPLWDFPDGTLAAREVAAYRVSIAAGWNLVPLTVLRDGPFGPGMCQVWVTETGVRLVDVVEPGAAPTGWRHVLDAADGAGRRAELVHADDPRLRAMALFDVVINNADRKGGHILCADGDAVLGVDHGVSFHHEDKLRTVLWGWQGEALTDAERGVLEELRSQLGGSLGGELAELLTPAEADATRARVEALIRHRRFPAPAGRLRPIPWPAF